MLSVQVLVQRCVEGPQLVHACIFLLGLFGDVHLIVHDFA